LWCFLRKYRNIQYNFMDFINRLRQKTPEAKKGIAFAASAVVTLVIFGVWASVLHFGINSKSGDATAAVANSSETDINPLSAFWDVISTSWNGLSDNINQVKTKVGGAKDFVDSLNAVSDSSISSTSPTPVSATPVPTAPSVKDVFILDNTTQ
jgi:hypothetical protein